MLQNLFLQRESFNHPIGSVYIYHIYEAYCLGLPRYDALVDPRMVVFIDGWPLRQLMFLLVQCSVAGHVGRVILKQIYG